MIALEPVFKAATIYTADAGEAIAAVVIAAAAIRAIVALPRAVSATGGGTEPIRLRLGRWLSLALEFELAADILRTAVAPTWNEIGQLAAIIVLRTALNSFLQREIDTATARPS